jgi:hypothetical protein
LFRQRLICFWRLEVTSSASLESPKEENTREIEAINEEVIVKASKENVDCESVSEQDEEEEEEEEKEESVDSKPRIVDVIVSSCVFSVC